MNKKTFITKNNGDILNASEWNELTGYTNEIVDTIPSELLTWVTNKGYLSAIEAVAGASINTVGTPSVTASNANGKTTLTFNNLKGEKGADGTGIALKGSAAECKEPGDAYINQSNGHIMIFDGKTFSDGGEIKGPKGDSGPANTLTIGSVLTGAAGSTALATITGTAPNQVLNLTIPRGNNGDPAALNATLWGNTVSGSNPTVNGPIMFNTRSNCIKESPDGTLLLIDGGDYVLLKNDLITNHAIYFDGNDSNSSDDFSDFASIYTVNDGLKISTDGYNIYLNDYARVNSDGDIYANEFRILDNTRTGINCDGWAFFSRLGILNNNNESNATIDEDGYMSITGHMIIGSAHKQSPYALTVNGTSSFTDDISINNEAVVLRKSGVINAGTIATDILNPKSSTNILVLGRLNNTNWYIGTDGSASFNSLVIGGSTVASQEWVNSLGFLKSTSGGQIAPTLEMHKIWGQSFNGTLDVTGNMTGVGTISASGNIMTSGDYVGVLGLVYIHVADGIGVYTHPDENTQGWLIRYMNGNTYLGMGRVGIGVTSPTEMLDVNGTIRGITAKVDSIMPKTNNTVSIVGNCQIGSSSGETSYRLRVNGGTTAVDSLDVYSTINGYLNSTSNWNITNTGNATFNGTITAATIKKSGGTASLFLKADGSVDSNSYLSSATKFWGRTASGGEVTGELTGVTAISGKDNTGSRRINFGSDDPSEITILGKLTMSLDMRSVSNSQKFSSLYFKLADITVELAFYDYRGNRVPYDEDAFGAIEITEGDCFIRIGLDYSNIGPGYYGLYSEKFTIWGYDELLIGVSDPITLGGPSIYFDKAYNSITSSTTINTSSDSRLKDIQSEFKLAIEDIADLQAIKYKWNKRDSVGNYLDDSIHIGAIAQQWKNILPEVVSTNKDGMLSLDYSGANMAAVISIAKEVVDHKNQIYKLEKRVKELEKIIDELN